MEKIRRQIKLFWSQNGKLLFQIIGIFILIFLVIQFFNRNAIEQAEIANLQNESAYKNELENQKKNNIEENEKKYIEQFINYCNTGKIAEAYNMLSETCKKEQYNNNIDQFRNEYINQIFNINICKYEIVKMNDIYVVTLLEDIIATGKIDSIKEQQYRIVGVLERKIEIYKK